jgi:UDP-N-acetyl-D-mannosaminuronate dehydrogenase
VREWTVQGVPVRRYPSIESALEEPDIVILVQAHSAYDRDALGRSGALLLDTRGVLAGPTVHTL